MRLLYLYSEEWTGHRAREVHTLCTCVALAHAGVRVTLVTAGGEAEFRQHLLEMTGEAALAGLQVVALSRALGPIRSTSIFARNLQHWLQVQTPFDLAFIIHLKAAAVLAQAGIPYAYEAHEVFAQTPQNAVRQRKLHKLERHVVRHAQLRIATSGALAAALSAWYDVPKEGFAVVPNAGLTPLAHSVSSPDGPFVYAGSIADWKGLPVAIHAAREAGVPLRIIGGDEEQWAALGNEIDTSGIEWLPRVSLHDLPALLSDARGGLIPTNPDTPSGEYSCPMKLFDYARCGLPVITTALPSLQSLDVGPWCTQVLTSTRIAWTEALKTFQYDAAHADEALAWSGRHTWEERAQQLKRLFEA